MEQTLLEKALTVKLNPRGKHVKRTDEDYELVVAYLSGQINHKQIMTSLGFGNSGNLSHYISSVLMDGIRAGKIIFGLSK